MASACGKVILLGEHGVVHGRPALALAVPHGAEATATPSAHGPTRLRIEPWQVDVDTSSTPNPRHKQLACALQVAHGFYPAGLHLTVQAQVQLPGSAGMGSSAALGVAVLRAMAQAHGITLSDREVYARSLAWERVFHGNPSGVDNAMATYGGMAVFRRGEELKRVVPRHRVRLVAAFSGETASTKTMVASVARALERDPARVGKIFDGMEALVNNGRLAVETGDMRGLGQLMMLNHRLLSSLMLSTMVLEDMIAAAERAGALGAKVTGAGGGGCMIALVESDETHRAVHAALQALGKPTYDVESGP